ncbi:MAG TPA: hypothetical protein VHE33_19840 [Acidobacteriaceae bacterium]|nr:hypothetical protein [Acidobacteriaceae bacterium]
MTCCADVAEIVTKTFRELGFPLLLSQQQAKLLETCQIAREVIAGERNSWAAASHLEYSIWKWETTIPEVADIFAIHDEIDWEPIYRRSVTDLYVALIEAFARAALIPDSEIAKY